LAIRNIEQSAHSYSTLFGADPGALKPDYAKWMLEDPRVNFAISTRGVISGPDHLGIQVESKEELGDIAERLAATGRNTYDQGEAHCCYAHSHKAWVRDPQGLPWETFFTFGGDTVYGEGSAAAESEAAPKAASRSTCCIEKVA